MPAAQKIAVEQGVTVPPWSQVDFAPLALPEEQTLIKRLLQFPELVEGAARAREPHRVAYYLTELAGLFHPYYKAHRVITDDRAQTLAGSFGGRTPHRGGRLVRKPGRGMGGVGPRQSDGLADRVGGVHSIPCEAC